MTLEMNSPASHRSTSFAAPRLAIAARPEVPRRPRGSGSSDRGSQNGVEKGVGSAAHDSAEPADSVEKRLARLAAAVGPLRRVMAAIAARLLDTGAFERLCYARLGDYARERPGISARQIQDLARVHRALPELPDLERALLANLLPWSKVRLVARIATHDDELAWIARARAIPTRQLELEVRALPRTARNDLARPHHEDLPERRLALRCTPAVREKWSVVCEMAERVAGQRLSSGDVLELVSAEVFSELSIDPAFVSCLQPRVREQSCEAVASCISCEPTADVLPAGPAPPAREPTPGLPAAVTCLAVGLECADAFELDRRLCRAIQLEQSLDADMAPLLRRVRSAGYEWREGYRPLEDYAPDQLGMSASKARALLRLERAGDVCLELREAWREGRISWVKAQCLVPLLLLDVPGEWRPAWVAWAERVTLRRLVLDVDRALLLRAGHPRAWQRCKLHPERTQDPIPPDERQLCAPGFEPDFDPEATQRLVWRVPEDVALLFHGVHRTLRARLALGWPRPLSDGQVFDALLDSVLHAWTLVEPGRRRPDPVIERDGYRCTVPGCSSRRNLHDHHIVFRSALGSDAPSNRTTLCAFHHHRCLHAGRLRLHGRAPDDLVFELGLRSGGPPLARYRDGDILLEGDSMSAL